MATTDNIAAFKKTMAALNKKYEKVLVSAAENARVKKFNFGSPQLTYLFSGFGYDRVHQLYGPPSAGKSSIATYIASQCQKTFPERPVVVYVDFEKSFDMKFAEKIGLKCDDDHFVLVHADNIEDAATVVEELAKTNCVCCLIFDSDATAPTRTELADEANKANFGSGALAFTRVLRRWNVMISKYEFPLLWISQERVNMAMFSHLPSVTGGSAPPYYSTTRNRVTKLDNIVENGQIVGIHIRVRNYKNKGGVPFRDAEMDLYFDGGFKVDNEYVDFLVSLGIFKQGGAWFTCTYFDENNPIKCNGKQKIIEWAKANPDKYEELKAIVIAKLLGYSEELDANNVDPETTPDGQMLNERSTIEDDIKAIEEEEAAAAEDPSPADLAQQALDVASSPAEENQ